jgi:hypothetical protein
VADHKSSLAQFKPFLAGRLLRTYQAFQNSDCERPTICAAVWNEKRMDRQTCIDMTAKSIDGSHPAAVSIEPVSRQGFNRRHLWPSMNANNFWSSWTHRQHCTPWLSTRYCPSDCISCPIAVYPRALNALVPYLTPRFRWLSFQTNLQPKRTDQTSASLVAPRSGPLNRLCDGSHWPVAGCLLYSSEKPVLQVPRHNRMQIVLIFYDQSVLSIFLFSTNIRSHDAYYTLEILMCRQIVKKNWVGQDKNKLTKYRDDRSERLCCIFQKHHGIPIIGTKIDHLDTNTHNGQGNSLWYLGWPPAW